MTTHIFNEHNQCISEGKNLAVINRYARQNPVLRVSIAKTRNQFLLWPASAIVNIHYKNGYRAVTNFVSYSHAVEWANDLSKNRNSWFYACKVEAQ